MKEQILQLRSEGKTYDQIKTILGCSKSTISYYCGEGQREKNIQRRKNRRKNALVVKTDSFKYHSKGLNNKFTHYKNRGDGTYDYSYEDIKKIVEDNPSCYLTGRVINFNDPGSYHFDHKLPLALGGDNRLENLGIACQEANSAKADLSLEDFLDLCYDVLKHHGRI